MEQNEFKKKKCYYVVRTHKSSLFLLIVCSRKQFSFSVDPPTVANLGKLHGEEVGTMLSVVMPDHVFGISFFPFYLLLEIRHVTRAFF